MCVYTHFSVGVCGRDCGFVVYLCVFLSICVCVSLYAACVCPRMCFCFLECVESVCVWFCVSVVGSVCVWIFVFAAFFLSVHLCVCVCL